MPPYPCFFFLEVYPIEEDGSGGVNELEYNLLSEIIERINEVYGIE